MKIKKLILAALAVLTCLSLCACKNEEEGYEELNPEEFSYDMLDLSIVVDEVYNRSMAIISVTAVLAIWSASTGVHYLADGLNAVNDLEETRSWFKLRLGAVFYTVVFLVAIVLTLVLVVFGSRIYNSLEFFKSQTVYRHI